MNRSMRLPSIEDLKHQAKRLRNGLAEGGDFISHSESLELIARQYGMRDWNTLHANAGNRKPAPIQIGARIKGRYLGQKVSGEVIGVRTGSAERTQITVQLDEPVDVVTFDSFSAYRQRITATINAHGRTMEKTSDGAPHLLVEAIQ